MQSGVSGACLPATCTAGVASCSDAMTRQVCNPDAGTVAYNLEVSCLLGGCTPPPPSCTLTDTATYDATTSTLTMAFTEGNNYAAVWHTWLNYQGTMTQLFSVAQPITVPPATVTKTATLAKEGEVAVISTLTTATRGITCSSYVKVATGTP